MPMKNPPHPGDFVRTEIIGAAGLTVTAAASALRIPFKGCVCLAKREFWNMFRTMMVPKMNGMGTATMNVTGSMAKV